MKDLARTDSLDNFINKSNNYYEGLAEESNVTELEVKGEQLSWLAHLDWNMKEGSDRITAKAGGKTVSITIPLLDSCQMLLDDLTIPLKNGLEVFDKIMNRCSFRKAVEEHKVISEFNKLYEECTKKDYFRIVDIPFNDVLVAYSYNQRIYYRDNVVILDVGQYFTLYNIVGSIEDGYVFMDIKEFKDAYSAGELSVEVLKKYHNENFIKPKD